MELSGGTELIDGLVETTESVAERMGQVVRGIDEGGRGRAEDAQVDLGAEEGDAQAEAGEGVAVGAGHALDQAVEAEASEVVGHGGARVGGEVAAEQGGELGSKVAVAEAGREMGEATEGLEQRYHARVAEAEGRDALAVLLARGLELGEGILAQRAVLAEPLDREHLLIDPGTGRPKLGQGLQRFLGLEVGRVVDGGLGSERSLFLEVLLDVGVLVLDVQAGRDPGSDDAGPVAVRGCWRAAGDPLREQQADAIGAAEVEVLADHRLEEVPPLDRLVEDLGPTDLELPDAQPMLVPGRSVGGGQRPGQVRLPTVEEPLHVRWTEAVADRLEPCGVVTGQEAVVEAG